MHNILCRECCRKISPIFTTKNLDNLPGYVERLTRRALGLEGNCQSIHAWIITARKHAKRNTFRDLVRNMRLLNFIYFGRQMCSKYDDCQMKDESYWLIDETSWDFVSFEDSTARRILPPSRHIPLHLVYNKHHQVSIWSTHWGPNSHSREIAIILARRAVWCKPESEHDDCSQILQENAEKVKLLKLLDLREIP